MGIALNLVGRETIKILYPNDNGVFQSAPIERATSATPILLDIDCSNGITIGKKYLKGLRAIVCSGPYHLILEDYYSRRLLFSKTIKGGETSL